MRGKQQNASLKPHKKRITPADAGKTLWEKPGLRLLWDHPRVCGENTVFMRCTVPTVGSPPRMRGKPHQYAAALGVAGITPAGAGKTRSRERHCNSPRDHPRRCGENRLRGCGLLCILGSPPRMRGKQRHRGRDCAAVGITPAYAGKTFIRWGLRHTIRDHPRGCGENCIVKQRGQLHNGSPPRMRGKLICRYAL